MITRCLENRVFAITANRVGVEDRTKGKRLKFIGQSEIIQPDGKVLYRASDNREETKVIEIDPKIARDKRVTSSNDIFNDRREEFYGV
jgi:predicted amidohydrolase